MRKVLCIPCGRPPYLAILRKYVERDRHLFDACHLWVNCPEEHIDYLEEWAESDPSFYQLLYLPRPLFEPTDIAHRGGNVQQFLSLAQDPDTLYVKMDDDTVFLEHGALESLITYRERHPDPLQVICNTVNNAACAHFHQGNGAFSGVENLLLSGNGSALVHHPHLGESMNEAFLCQYQAKNLNIFRFKSFQPPIIPICLSPRYGIRWPNQVYAFWGRDYRFLADQIAANIDEEWFLTVEAPRLTGRPVIYLGDKLAVHYSYNKQDAVLSKREDLLTLYRQIAEVECLP